MAESNRISILRATFLSGHCVWSGRLLSNTPIMAEFRKNNKGGFHENRLIRCVRDKEREMRRRHTLDTLGKAAAKVVSHDMKVDRWFLTRFSIDGAYLALCQEFYSLSGSLGAWESSGGGKGGAFIDTPIGGNATRQLKVKAQHIGSPCMGEYIASEGPTKSSVYDFWNVIWQEGVHRILSVNFPHEERLYPEVFDPAKETTQYWPMVVGSTHTYMPYRVTCVESRMMMAPNLRALSIEEMVYRVCRLRMSYSNPMKEQEPEREIVHICYYRWPDGRIPIPWPPGGGTHSQAALRLVEAVRKDMPVTSGPLLVHCHAGLGRTGVIISIDMALRQLTDFNTVNVKAVVESIRAKRSRAVMNPWQYATINVVIAEKALQSGLLPSSVGGHSVRALIEKMWTSIVSEIDRHFNGTYVTFSPELL